MVVPRVGKALKSDQERVPLGLYKDDEQRPGETCTTCVINYPKCWNSYCTVVSWFCRHIGCQLKLLMRPQCCYIVLNFLL